MSHNQTESGATFPANVTVPDGGDPVTANSVQVIAQSLGNRTQHLDTYKVETVGGTLTGGTLAGTTTVPAGADTLVIAGTIDVTSGGVAVIATGGDLDNHGTSTTFSDGVEIHHGRSQRFRARVSLSDASQTINVTGGDTFILPAAPAAMRTITCGTTGTPVDGETMTLIWNPVGAAPGVQYTIEDGAAGILCTLVQSSVTTEGYCWVEVECVNTFGQTWRLRRTSGSFTDSNDDDCGVLPGAAA